jgi:hypothetical protein
MYKVESKLDFNSVTTSELMEKTKKAIAYHLFRDIGRANNRDSQLSA